MEAVGLARNRKDARVIYEMTTIFLWLLFGGVCLIVASVFVALSVMIVKSGWEAMDKKPKEEYEPLRKERP